jgi:hypothetical protein
MDLASFIQKWRHASSGSERGKDLYVFEADVLSVCEGGDVTVIEADWFARAVQRPLSRL